MRPGPLPLYPASIPTPRGWWWGAVSPCVRGTSVFARRLSPSERGLGDPGLLQVALGFEAVHLEGVELMHMGQQLLGQYPLHFHLAGDLDERGGYDPPTYVRELSIHHTFSRCVTVHGSNGLLVSRQACTDIAPAGPALPCEATPSRVPPCQAPPRPARPRPAHQATPRQVAPSHTSQATPTLCTESPAPGDHAPRATPTTCFGRCARPSWGWGGSTGLQVGPGLQWT